MTAPENESGDPKDPKNRRVLIVEDDDDVRTLLSDIVRRQGFQVETALDGREALEKVRQRAPDVVVLDLMLPVFGGYEMLKRLQAEPVSGLPVVVVSGRYTDPGTVELLRREANVVDFFEKPVRAEDLTQRLHGLLGTRGPAA